MHSRHRLFIYTINVKGIASMWTTAPAVNVFPLFLHFRLDRERWHDQEGARF